MSAVFPGGASGKGKIGKEVKLLCRVRLCDPRDCIPPGSFVHRILQARILELVAISSSRGSSRPRDQTHISCVAGRLFITEPPGKPSDQIKLTQLIQDVARFLVSSPLLDKETYTGPGGLVCG